MNPSTARHELEDLFVQSGLDLNALDPWEAWKLFKTFLRQPVDGGYDTAGVQLSVSSDTQSLHLIRQLSRWNHDQADDDAPDDEVIWMITVEFFYKSARLANSPELDIWSMDFRMLEEFASVVEGEPSFQAAMAARPFATACCTPEV